MEKATRQIMKHASRSQQSSLSAKVIIVGDTGVGKTNILTRFCDSQYKESHVSTIGVDFNYKVVKVGESAVKLQVWDTAGQERFKTIT